MQASNHHISSCSKQNHVFLRGCTRVSQLLSNCLQPVLYTWSAWHEATLCLACHYMSSIRGASSTLASSSLHLHTT